MFHIYKQTELAFKSRSCRGRESNHGPPAFRADVFTITPPRSSDSVPRPVLASKKIDVIYSISSLLFTAICDPIIFGIIIYGVMISKSGSPWFDSLYVYTHMTDTKDNGVI